MRLSRTTEFNTVASNIVSLIFAVSSLRTEACMSSEPDESEVHRTFQNCGFSLWDLIHVTLLAPRIWTWLLEVWKIFGPIPYGLNSQYIICELGII